MLSCTAVWPPRCSSSIRTIPPYNTPFLYAPPYGCDALSDNGLTSCWTHSWASATDPGLSYGGGQEWTPELLAGDGSAVWVQFTWRHPVTIDGVQVMQRYGSTNGGVHAKEITFEFSDDHRIVATETIGPFPRDNSRKTCALSRALPPCISPHVPAQCIIITLRTRTNHVCACRASHHCLCQDLAGHLALQLQLQS